jgi:hypothetical protein
MGVWCRLVRRCVPKPPAAVTGVAAGPAGGSGEVQITWNPHPEPRVAWYRVYRADRSGGPYDHAYLVVDAESPDLPGQHGVLEIGVSVRRYYRVSAVTADGREGPISAEVTGAPVGVP